MHWLQHLDTSLFHWVNPALSDSVLDVLMPFCSSPPFFLPIAILLGALVIWKGGARGRLCMLMLVLAVGLSDGVVCNTLKHLIGRPRPFLTLADVHVPASIGRTSSGSMPSSHASNCFAATIVLFLYYRKSIRFMLPLALLVSFSRIYNGVHYPGDVLAGAIIGIGCGAAAVFIVDAAWQCAGRRWFPLWWQRLPSLFNPIVQQPSAPANSAQLDQHWLRLAYLFIALELIANLAYLASGKLGLTGDEAYQWTWSKHLALSYYSKPLLIAVAQFIGTTLFGDTEFGVRFLSPIISAVLGVILLRFLSRAANVRAAFWLSVILPTVPLLAVGSVLMTVDPLSVMFWTLAMIAGWRAIQDHATTADWLWVGLWMGLGFLSKYTALFQLLSWAAVFALIPSSRKQLRRPGPWLALFVNFLCSLPVLIWNYQRHWITVQNVADAGHFSQQSPLSPASLWHGLTHYTGDFLGGEFGLLNPFFVIPTVWAAFAFWRYQKSSAPKIASNVQASVVASEAIRNPQSEIRNSPLLVFFFSMGASVFLPYCLWTLHSRVYLNWIAPSIVPFLCLAVVYWEQRWRTGAKFIQCWLTTGLVIGAIAVVLLHDSSLVPRLIGRPLPANLNLWQRAQAWPETADFAESARQKLLAEGKPVFIIGSHYSITGEMSFYIPEARESIRDEPLVYFLHYDTPQNQFFFWPWYNDRRGQNAIYVNELDFLHGKPEPPPKPLTNQFDSVTDLGEHDILLDGRIARRLQIYECRGLR